MIQLLAANGDQIAHSWTIEEKWHSTDAKHVRGRLSTRSNGSKYEAVGSGETWHEAEDDAWERALDASPLSQGIETTEIGDTERTVAAPAGEIECLNITLDKGITSGMTTLTVGGLTFAGVAYGDLWTFRIPTSMATEAQRLDREAGSTDGG